MVYVSGFDRTQTALFPVTVDEMIDETNVVRLVDRIHPTKYILI